MADVDGALMNGSTFDPLRENAGGAAQETVTADPLAEPGDAVEVCNSTTVGGDAILVRSNPKLTREDP